MTSICCIDPGVSGTGYALWKNLGRDKKYQHPKAPDKTFSTIPKKGTWLHKAGIVAFHFSIAFVNLNYKIDEVHIEFPELWVGSEKSMASTVRGDIFKTAFLCGRLAEIAEAQGSKVFLIKPREWKGQLSKTAVDARIKKAINKKYPNHISDAVGMGLNLQGYL